MDTTAILDLNLRPTDSDFLLRFFNLVQQQTAQLAAIREILEAERDRTTATRSAARKGAEPWPQAG